MLSIAVFSIVFLHLHVHADRTCVKYGPPDLIRVAIRGENEVTVSWRTHGIISTKPGTIPHSNDVEYPTVEYATNPQFNISVFSAEGDSSTYGSPWINSWFHNCVLLVRPSTRYYYRIPAVSPCMTQSDPHSFMTPPSFGSVSPINITIVGDLGNDALLNNNSATKTIEALAEIAANTDFFLHVGDISYADDPYLQWELYEGAWDEFQKNVERISSEHFYMTVPGNHEVTCDQEGDSFCTRGSAQYYRNFTAYSNRFRMPGKESGGYGNMWYSYNFGPVHMVIIDTETDFPRAPAGPGTSLNGGNFVGEKAQVEWLQRDLQRADDNRHNVPWVIVAGHRPFFGSGPYYNISSMNHSDNCEPCSTAFGGLLYQFNVDFYFCGHVHWNERLFPVNGTGYVVARNYNNQKGVIHVTTGAGGAAEGANAINETAVSPASAKVITGYGYARLEIKDSSNCRLSFYDSVNKRETDSVDIIRVH